MTASCRPCASGFHDHCKDPRPGEQCNCPCPDPAIESRRTRVNRLKRRLKYLHRATQAAEQELAALTTEDPLAQYRRSEDRRLGRRRLELATKEMYGT